MQESSLPRPGFGTFAPWLLIALLVELCALVGVDEWVWPHPTKLLDEFEVALAEIQKPKPVMLSWIDIQPTPKVEPEKPEFKPKKKKPKAEEPLPEEAQPLAVVVPPPPPPPPPEEEQKKPPKPPETPAEQKKSVLLQDENLVNEPPPEAEYWSDKNRRVSKQTRAEETNLEKFSKGDAKPSAESDDTKSPEVGGEEERIRQQEEAEASAIDVEREEVASVHDGKSKSSKGLISGEEGREGEEGDEGDDATGKGTTPGPLSMRNPDGRLAPGARGGGSGAEGRGKAGKSGKAGRKGPRLAMEFDDYERVVGQEAYREEKQLARRQTSHKKGRWTKKMSAIRSSIENFVPEVQPGNQTALNTRAVPFAAYIAKMHLSIHELWGFGFLEDLANVPSSDPMNDLTLAVQLEIVLTGEGEVEKVTIVRPSGALTFDVAAVDTVLTAGPYGSPPPDILSGNGKVYMHWTLHRDHRQCATYFAQPFILDNAGRDADRGKGDGHLTGSQGPMRQPQVLSREKGSPTKGGTAIPRGQAAGEEEGATAGPPRPEDPDAQTAALVWASAYQKGDSAALAAMSATPFVIGDLASSDPGFIAGVWKGLIGEAGRKIVGRRLLTAAGYRATFGYVPQGARQGEPVLFLVVQTGEGQFTVWLLRGADGQWRASGLSRR